jgi:hypothetical protein
MDGLSKEVRFTFYDLTSDGARLSQPWEVYLSIVGRFSVRVGERVLYAEELFCVVEFAIKSQLWLRRVKDTDEDFVYTSQESDEPSLFWIKKSREGWRLGSVYQEYEEPTTFDLDSLAAGLSAYFDRLREFVAEGFGTDIVAILRWAEVNQVG